MIKLAKMNYKKNSAFMIFGMLLLGTFFLLLLVTVDAFYSIGFIERISLLANKLKLDSKSVYLIVPITILVLYSIGFVIYLSSFVFLSSPSWLVMKLIYRKNLFSIDIADNIFKSNENLEQFTQGGLLFKRGFLYFLLRNETDAVSSDVTFTFTQLMYGRAILFTIVLAVISIFGLRGDIVFLLLYGLFAYIIAILVYAMGLKFFDDILSMGYLSKNVVWLKQPKKPKKKKANDSKK